jgi:hypothetical protein
MVNGMHRTARDQCFMYCRWDPVTGAPDPKTKGCWLAVFFMAVDLQATGQEAEGAWCPREFERHCFFPLDRLFMNKTVAALDVQCNPRNVHWTAQAEIYGMSNTSMGCPI